MQTTTGKTALITGGASGIGLGMAAAFLEAGMRVAIADVREEKLVEAAARLSAGERLLTLPVDVTYRQGMAAAARTLAERFGPLHVLCNNAGLNGQTSLDEVGPAEWDWLVDVNLNGVMNGLFAFLPGMKAHGEGGHVVNTASMAGILPMPAPGGTYTALKFAVRGLSDALRLALAPHGIGVSTLCPGLVRTDIRASADTLMPEAVRQCVSRPVDNPMQGDVDPSNAGMDPLEVGRRVLAGIVGNEAYILPHGEFVEEVRAEFDAILAAFPADQAPDPVRGFYEERRRGAVLDAKRQAAALT